MVLSKYIGFPLLVFSKIAGLVFLVGIFALKPVKSPKPSQAQIYYELKIADNIDTVHSAILYKMEEEAIVDSLKNTENVDSTSNKL